MKLSTMEEIMRKYYTIIAGILLFISQQVFDEIRERIQKYGWIHHE